MWQQMINFYIDRGLKEQIEEMFPHAFNDETFAESSGVNSRAEVLRYAIEENALGPEDVILIKLTFHPKTYMVTHWPTT